MHDYQKYALMLRPIEEKDLILFNVSAEEKSHIVKQYNRALVNAQKDGTDVAQIFLKPLISQYPTWGDTALIFGLCLAREGEFERAIQSLEYAVNNVLSSEMNLQIAQEAIRNLKADASNPDLKKEAAPRSKGGKNAMVAEGAFPTNRTGMQAPILMRASNKPAKIQLASDKERRDILMRGASGGDEMPGDDINVESVRTPAENLRLTVKIIVAAVILLAVAAIVYFGIIPAVARVRSAADTDARLNYLTTKLDENKDDPEVAAIIGAYAAEFDAAPAAAETTPAESVEEAN